MHCSLRARAALLAMAAALSVAVATARNPTGCRSACDSVSFGAIQRTVLRLERGCVVRVTWMSRIGCVVGHDIVVLSVEPLTDDCGGIGVGRLVNEATDSLLASRETGFFYMSGVRDTCVVVGSVMRAACWRYVIDCGDSTAVGCDSSSCCQSQILLCTDEVGYRHVVRGATVLRAPCAADRHCDTVCGPRQWPPADSLAPGGADKEISLGRASRRGRGGRTIEHLDSPTPWPWRDPRAHRSPVRALREPGWRCA